jgi:cytochrome c553
MNGMTFQAFIICAAVAAANTAWAGDAAAGKEKSKPCAACHGETGISAAADFPKIAGQYNGYLLKALTDYKSGARKNPIMASQVTNLNPRDMEDLAAYYSSQTGLFTKR